MVRAALAPTLRRQLAPYKVDKAGVQQSNQSARQTSGLHVVASAPCVGGGLRENFVEGHSVGIRGASAILGRAPRRAI